MTTRSHRSSTRISILALSSVAAVLSFASMAAADAAPSMVLRYDAVGAAGGFIGGTQLGTTAGQAVIGEASSISGDLKETAGFWHPRTPRVLAVGANAPQALAFAASPIAPNPMVHHTTLRFVIPGTGDARAHASVRVFDVSGRMVRELASGAQAAGAHTVTWDGRDANGAQLGAGVFFVELAAGSNRNVQRVTVLR